MMTTFELGVPQITRDFVMFITGDLIDLKEISLDMTETSSAQPTTHPK